MNRFVEIEGYILSVDAIVMIHPARDGKAFVQLVGDKGHVFSEEAVVKLRKALNQDFIQI